MNAARVLKIQQHCFIYHSVLAVSEWPKRRVTLQPTILEYVLCHDNFIL